MKLIEGFYLVSIDDDFISANVIRVVKTYEDGFDWESSKSGQVHRAQYEGLKVKFRRAIVKEYIHYKKRGI